MERQQPVGRRNLDHEIPSWVDADASDFFITICCRRRNFDQLCLPHVSTALLDSVRFYHAQRKWFPFVFLLMPDHLHMIVAFGHGYRMEKVIADWKRFTAKQQDIVWQDGFFDHRLRRDESWEEKAVYILQNPVRAGLAAEAKDWPHVVMVDQHPGGECRCPPDKATAG